MLPTSKTIARMTGSSSHPRNLPSYCGSACNPLQVTWQSTSMEMAMNARDSTCQKQEVQIEIEKIEKMGSAREPCRPPSVAMDFGSPLV